MWDRAFHVGLFRFALTFDPSPIVHDPTTTMRHLLLSAFLLAHTIAPAQQKGLPTIRASRPEVDITENGVLHRGAWTISPQLKPDVYATSTQGGRVTFHTDLDSISFSVGPGEVHDFIILRGKQKAWTRIAYKPSFQEVLQGASAFGPAGTRPFPAFTYQSPDAPELVALRTALDLDSIAGQGNEISRMLEVMHWLHDLVPHDGQHGNPEVMNAMSMIAACKRDHRGLNCRGLATVLNECYLALGFKSRFLTCLPYDTADADCHVIDMVWSTDLKKWIWLDPTQDAWVMDGTGMLLGPAEVRERLIDGRPLILNPDANWNHRISSLREDYLMGYMAKNLYRFECPLASCYGSESPGTNKTVAYVDLLPLDFHTQTPDVEHSTNTTGNGWVVYRTNDAAAFWAPPQ